MAGSKKYIKPKCRICQHQKDCVEFLLAEIDHKPLPNYCFSRSFLFKEIPFETLFKQKIKCYSCDNDLQKREIDFSSVSTIFPLCYSCYNYSNRLLRNKDIIKKIYEKDFLYIKLRRGYIERETYIISDKILTFLKSINCI